MLSLTTGIKRDFCVGRGLSLGHLTVCSSIRFRFRFDYFKFVYGSQLLLDDRSKTNNFQIRLLYFRPKLAAHQGSSAGTVLDLLLDHIGNVQNWTAESVQFLIQL